MCVAVFRILQRDVVQRHVELWREADPGRARYCHPVSGLALEAGLYRRGHETGGNPDNQQQRGDDDHGGDGGACDFQCSHVDIPNRASGTDFSPAVTGHLSEKRRLLKAAQNNPECRKAM
jgi:hypothetical protein